MRDLRPGTSASLFVHHPHPVALGSPPAPGDISLTHHGVPYLDEVSEFDREAIDRVGRVPDVRQPSPVE